MSGLLAFPERKKLPHEIPSWAADGAVYFVTINCVPHSHNQLAIPSIASAIDQSILYYQNASKWWIHLLLLMPDHLHGLISFSRDISMRRLIFDWKRFLARQNGIEWQRDFFDHRIRDDTSLMEKWHYIRNNPIRKGLAQTPGEWPYQWQYGAVRSDSLGRAVFPKPPMQNTTTVTAVSEKPPYPANMKDIRP